MLLLIGVTFKIIVVASLLLGAVAYLIYVERKIAAYAQDRRGALVANAAADSGGSGSGGRRHVARNYTHGAICRAHQLPRSGAQA